MKSLLLLSPSIAILSLAGCGSETPPVSAAPQLDPDDPSIMRRPFTAEQIRDEWIPGFTIDMQRRTPDATVVERWTVIAADAEQVDIEYVTLDEAGEPSGERRVGKAGWVELRDHATFPADRSTLEEVTRETAIGVLEGWLYTVRDDQAGAVTEFFFARALPGAPVHMRSERAGELVMELRQIARRRP